MTLLEFCDEQYVPSNLNLSADSAQQVRIAAAGFQQLMGELPLEAIEVQHIRDMMKQLLAKGRSARTANNRRSTVLTLLRAAADLGLCRQPGRVTRAVEPRREPRAWSPAEMARILIACGTVKCPRSWTADHWRALILVVYDTSHRIGALLKARRDQLNGAGLLHLYAEQTKQKGDTVHRLHAETLAVLASLPKHSRLFPWPLQRRAIWPHLKRILIAADLPCSRRDLFHKIRRTSYTVVWAVCGPDAATRHAGHATNLQKAYLDVELARSLRGEEAPIDIMPRPGAA